MKNGRSLQELAQELDRQNNSKRDFTVDTAAIELELPAISQAIVAGAAAVGFAVESQTVEVVGLCAGCQGAA